MRQKQIDRLLSSFFGSVAFLVLAAGLLPAQVPTATLTGLVKDATGAVVPEVKVTATNTNTNLSRETITDASGAYSIPALNPGPYRLDATAKGFKSATLSNIVLQVAQQVRVDVDLQVGDVSQSLEVTGAASLVDTESNMIGGVINESRVVKLPLN